MKGAGSMHDRPFFPGDIVKDTQTGEFGVVLATVEFEANKFQAERVQVTATFYFKDKSELTVRRRQFGRFVVAREAITSKAEGYNPTRLIRKFERDFK